MKIAVTGAYGLLGEELVRVLGEKHEMIPFPRRQDLDLRDREKVFSFVETQCPDVVIHCAAIRDLDPLEVNPDLAWKNNIISTVNVVHASNKIDCTLVYISSDSVFCMDRDEPYHEFDTVTTALSVYGSTKLSGELFVREQIKKLFVVRVPWLYGQTGGPGKNWIIQMVQKVKSGQTLTAAEDQLSSVLYTTDAAAALSKMLETEYWGVYHLANEGPVTRCEIMRAVLREAGLAPEAIKGMPMADLDRPARRAKKIMLTSLLLERVFGIRLPHWKERLPICIEKLKAEGCI